MISVFKYLGILIFYVLVPLILYVLWFSSVSAIAPLVGGACLFIYFKFIYFIFDCVGSLLRCAGYSLQWLLLLQSTGSRHVGFSSCGTWAQ